MQGTSPAEPLPARRTRSASSDNAAADRFSAWQKRTAAVRRAGTRMSARVVNSGGRLLAFPIRAPRHHPNAQMFPPHARARPTVSASTKPRSVRDRHARRSLDDKSPARGPSEYERRGLRVAYLALLGTDFVQPCSLELRRCDLEEAVCRQFSQSSWPNVRGSSVSTRADLRRDMWKRRSRQLPILRSSNIDRWWQPRARRKCGSCMSQRDHARDPDRELRWRGSWRRELRFSWIHRRHPGLYLAVLLRHERLRFVRV